MTLKELLEKTSRFQRVKVFYNKNSRSGKSSELLEHLGESWLKSSVMEIKADFSELLVEVGD